MNGKRKEREDGKSRAVKKIRWEDRDILVINKEDKEMRERK